MGNQSALFHFQPQTFYAQSGKLVPVFRLRPQPEATCHLRKLRIHVYSNSDWPRGMSAAWEDWLQLWTEWLFVLCTVLGKRACWSNIPDREEQLAAGAGCYLASGCRHTWDMKVWWSSCRSGLSDWFNWCGRFHLMLFRMIQELLKLSTTERQRMTQENSGTCWLPSDWSHGV